jgi:hypothetical protein
METSLHKFLDDLARGRDLEEILKEHGLTAEEAARLVESTAALADLAARRALSRAQAELQARGSAVVAVRKLGELVTAEKPELQLRASLALLNHMYKQERATAGIKQAAPQFTMDHAEYKEWMAAIAEVLLRRRQAQSMGPVRAQRVE